MRIGIDARMIDNTGIGRYLRNLLIQLARIDTRSEYVVFVNRNNSRVVTQNNVMFVPLHIAVPLYSLREQYWLPWEIRRWQPDLMHYPNFDLPLLRWSPYVVTIHDLIYYLYPDQCPSRAAHYYAGFMIKHAVAHARIVMTDSEYSKQDLIKHFAVPARKIRVVFPAADAQCCPRSVEEAHAIVRAQYGITQPYILYVGKQHPYKNIATMLRAYAVYGDIYDNFQMVIAGKKDERQKELYQLAETLNLGNRIIFTDFVKEETLFDLYRGARLFVFPSRYEGFGLPPLEAMACGVPVVCSNAASLPEVVGDAAIQVDPNNVRGFADAMQSVLTDQTQWEMLRQNGLRQARQFSWETAARQLLQVYEDALDAERR